MAARAPRQRGPPASSSNSPLLITAILALGALTVASAVYWITRQQHTSNNINASTSRTATTTSTIADSNRSKSKHKRLLTISAKNIIFWNPSKDPSHPNYAFLEGAIPTLSAILASGLYDVHLIIVVEGGDVEAAQITSLMASSGLAAAGLDSRRVLFCDTEEGKSHIVRHIEPQVHIDSNDDVISRLAPFINRIVRVRQTKVSGSNSSSSNNSSVPQQPIRRSSEAPGLTRTGSVRSLALNANSNSKADLLKSLPPHHAETELVGLALQELLRRGNVAMAESLDQAGLV
ncbi:hypothetical protein SmJEL517_g00808 [Synchytrium microbalum]|uniref:Peroxisome assembly protein 22 n=1 Tax=Synchytrium microbalum TaxID=1806994 RepID=A0A507CGD2_9FUNG|nr:uncharacterized protein SmJEL517_g00808 [Synchytrium microbalum]TPX37024.1 hypothetical protein SmJEL517_g00808 [Synchytrium microbalum]